MNTAKSFFIYLRYLYVKVTTPYSLHVEFFDRHANYNSKIKLLDVEKNRMAKLDKTSEDNHYDILLYYAWKTGMRYL